ncbi:MAG: cyclic nucleotide-binding domain-containing protein [Anaerolineales bacterium]|nr:cyclic nucleotide-binding domain-containing protein [Anaerolineales bacterium]MCX7609183.1 cyclic nucleotide-binding domain-containing protein [Anaerolineales bacterium]MDW8227778.1 cyclic nucleotide-binding domain-containing protein [Anaerolineales bacterium]
MDLKAYSSLAFFNGLSAADLEVLGPYFWSKRYVAGTVIFEQGERADIVYLMVSGGVTIRYKPLDGPPMIVTHIQPGGIFGWSAAIGNQNYTSGAVCSMDSEVLCIRGADLRYLCETNPHLGNLLLERLSSVVAERKLKRQQEVSLLITQGMRQIYCSEGDKDDGSKN